MIKFAQFGGGFIGKVHAGNIAAHPEAQLSLIYDVNKKAAKELACKVGANVADSPEQIWKSDVDAVVIASSTNTHADLLTRAIEAGKAVFCEKPIDLDIKRVKKVVSFAAKHPVPIMLGFSRRFDPNHLGVRDAVQSKQIGKLEILQLTSRGPTPPPISYVRVSGGQLRDQTIHFFDLACWISNQDPVEVYATGAALVDPAIGKAGDVDTSLVIMKLPSGAFVHIDSSRRTGYGYDERIEAFGSEGLAESQRKPTGEVNIYKGTSKISNGMHAGWFERMEPTFKLAVDAFVRSLNGEKRAYPNLMDGLRAQLIAEAAVKSLKTNKPVKIEYWKP